MSKLNPGLVVAQFISLLITLLMFKYLDLVLYRSLFCSILVTHYVFQLIHSRKEVLDLFSTNGFSRRVFPVLVATATSLTINVPIAIYFGLHQVFSEVCLFDSMNSRLISVMSFIGLFLCYSMMAHANEPLSSLSFGTLSFLAPLFIVSTAVLLARSDRFLRRPDMWPVALYLLNTVTFSLFFYLNNAGLREAIFYHILWWSSYPVLKNGRSVRGSLLYILGSILSVLAILYLSPVNQPKADQFSLMDKWDNAVILAGYLHISASFYLSKSNPRWVRGIFGQSDPKRAIPE